MRNGTIVNFIEDIGYRFDDLEIDEPYSVPQGWQVQTIDEQGNLDWRNVLHVVRKEPSPHYVLKSLDTERELHVAPAHRVFVKSKSTGVETYLEVSELEPSAQNFVVRTAEGWERFSVENLCDEIHIADMEVEGTHSYLSNGFLSHNTMYGDPTTTPGGAAIPYACSTRIRLYGGSQILDSKKNVIGIAVKAKTIKNKVARPFREAEFQIHFGVGVVESEEAFDALRRWCDENGPVEYNDNGNLVRISVEGTGAWKTFSVVDANGKTVHEEKWQGKSDFGDRVYQNPKYAKYVTALLDATFITTGKTEHHSFVDVDSDSLEDVRSLVAS